MSEQRNLRRFYFVSLLVVGLLLLPYFPVAAQEAPAPPVFQETSCFFDTSTLQMNVRCGLLSVPENRADPASRTITLAVMIAESPNPSKAPDPVLFLTGGPGESGIAAIIPLLSSEAGLRLVAERDWVILDQRGTGYSVPRLDCNIFGLARLVSPEALLQASESCHTRYAAGGIDLSGYTHDENAADVAALREALGYEAWNLFGVSYGTTLALTVMQNHPEGIRALVLDSTLPPQESFFVSDVVSKTEALARVFEACREDTGCDNAYPDLESRFQATVQALNESPLDFDGLLLTGDFLVFALTNTGVFQRDTIEVLPRVLHEAMMGDFAGLAALLGGVASGSDAESGYESDLVAANDGMGLAVNCSRDALFPNVQETLNELRTQNPVADALANLYLRYLEACQPWNTGLAPLTPPAPLESDIPVLFLVGEWDSSTPVSLAEQTAATLPMSQVVVFPGQGHSILLEADSPCPTDLINAFLNAPEAPLNTGCVAEEYLPLTFLY